jgi:SRSO17 transposase
MAKGGEARSLDAATWAVLETGQEEFERLLSRIGPRFRRAEVRQRTRRYLSSLLGPVRRRNGWQLAEQVGELTPDGIQRLMNEARWDADQVRDDLRAYVVEHLGDPNAVLVVDETGFLKKGTKSVGVARQYSGTAGRIENCQIGVFLGYASPQGRTFLDRALYLPEEWTNDPERCREAGVPETVTFRTKPQLALAMIERALDAGVPAGWVTADAVYGGDRRFRMALEQRGQPFVLGIPKNEPLWGWEGQGPTQTRAEARISPVPEEAWRRLSAGAGAKGPRLYDWAYVRLNRPGWPDHDHGLLVRRSIAEPTERAYNGPTMWCSHRRGRRSRRWYESPAVAG